ncbi:MAG: hypothetical protein KDJ35_02140 [Alphaproteobacteria bacterium]|nr:hypothetical protein [Alphaproteobacteria bacterium]
MIETVNSVISGTSTARAIAAEAVASNAAASNFELGDQVARAPVAPFVSPYYALDTNFDTAVLQIRDSETGDVLKQYPSEKTLEQRERAAAQLQGESSFARSERVDAPSAPQESAAFQATAIAQQGGQGGVVNTAGAAQAQAAIAAFSAGAQSGQVVSSSVNVTA